MGKYSTEVGMDVHGRSVTLRACDVETGEVRGTRMGDCPSAEQIAGWIKEGRGPWHAAYESGPTGFGLARELRALGVDCDVAAVTTLPRSAKGRARKNDKADADAIMQELLKPTRSFSCVWVPDEEVEGARNLARLRFDAAEALGRERRRLSSFLLAGGHVWNERTASGSLRRTWTAGYRKWLGGISFKEPAAEATFQQLKTAVSDAEARLEKAEELVREECGKPRWKPYVDALCCVKGIDLATAFHCAAEFGDFSRFANGRSVSSWLGCVPRQRATGEADVRGGITKAGNGRLRRLLVEGCASMPRWSEKKKAERARACVPEDVARVADEANRRLAARWRALHDERGMNANKAKVAVASEKARWVWVLGLMVQDSLASR